MPPDKIAVVVHEGRLQPDRRQRSEALPRKAGEFDYATLAVGLAAVKRTHPDRTDVQLMSADGIVFDTLVRTMAAGFPDLSLLEAILGS